MSNRLPAAQQPLEIQTIRLHKSNNGMGLSIVAAKVCKSETLFLQLQLKLFQFCYIFYFSTGSRTG